MKVVSRDKLFRAITPLKRSGVSFSVGGSGLLYACGLVDSVNDWDITTDHPFAELARALETKHWVLKPKTEAFDSDYVVHLPEYKAEVIGRFRINTPTGVCEIPSYIFSWWDRDIPLASPEAWFVAYRLMGRDEKANLLRQFITVNGADQNVASTMLDQPLPQNVRAEAEVLFRLKP